MLATPDSYARTCEKGLTQAQFAKLLGVNQQVVAYYEVEGVSPAPELLVKMADALDVSTDELLGRKTKRKDSPAPESLRRWGRFKRLKELPPHEHVQVSLSDNFEVIGPGPAPAPSARRFAVYVFEEYVLGPRRARRASRTTPRAAKHGGTKAEANRRGFAATVRDFFLPARPPLYAALGAAQSHESSAPKEGRTARAGGFGGASAKTTRREAIRDISSSRADPWYPLSPRRRS